MLFGIDVASVDGNKTTNWQSAKANGPLSFAILRSNFSNVADRYFAANWNALKSAGIVRGAYLFLVFPKNGKGAIGPDIQAQALVDTVGQLDTTDLPPTLDVEFPAGRAATGMTANEALDWVRAAWAVLRDRYGAPPIIYTSGRVWREDLNNIGADDLIESPLWLARYFWKERTPAVRNAAAFADGKRDPPVAQPWGDAWFVHQYQGDAIQFPGFSATVDCNRFNTLFRGSKGDSVKWIQRRLGIAASGKFDDATASKVVAFQAKNQLVSDAIIGPKTFAALCWA